MWKFIWRSKIEFAGLNLALPSLAHVQGEIKNRGKITSLQPALRRLPHLITFSCHKSFTIFFKKKTQKEKNSSSETFHES
jgi:hypothetical protein